MIPVGAQRRRAKVLRRRVPMHCPVNSHTHPTPYHSGPPGGNFELSVRLGGREVHYWLHRQDMQDLGCQNWAITEYIARAQRRNSGRVV